MTQYFDPDTRSIKRQVYSWDDTNDSSISWEDLTSWETATGGLYSIGAGDPITFRSDIKDFGRIADINPLCTVDAVGTVNVKVFAADSIDSSSLLPGDPVIDGGQSQTLAGVRGRYFQFLVEVTDDSDALAEILSVRTDLSDRTQQEGISGNSSDHGGTQLARILPITRNYSKLTSVVGNAEAVGSSRPWVTVGSIGDPTTPRYALFEFELDTEDSSTQIAAIKDEINDTTITVSGAVEASNTQAFYRWQPHGIIFNTDSSDNDAHIEFDPQGLGTGDFEIRMWLKLPNLAHPDHFFKLTAGSDNIRFKTSTGSNGRPEMQYSVNGATYTNTGEPPFNSAHNDWYHLAFWRSSGTFRFGFHHHNNTHTIGSYSWDLSSCTIELGDLGTGTTGFICMDDVAVKSASQYTTAYTGDPGAEEVAGADHVFLMNGTQSSESVLVGQNIIATDAPVVFQVTGLPKLVSDDAGNIVEQTP